MVTSNLTEKQRAGPQSNYLNIWTKFNNVQVKIKFDDFTALANMI